MLSLYIFFLVCTTYTVNADYGEFYNGYPQSYGSPPPPLPYNNGWNNNYWSNFQPLRTPPTPYYLPQNNEFKYNSNNNRFNNYNNGNCLSCGPIASVEVQNGVLMVNGKAIPGFIEDQGAVIRYGGGILTVNGERKKEFDGITGMGTIAHRKMYVGSNAITSVNNSESESDYDNDSLMDPNFTTPDYMGIKGQNVNTNQYGNTYYDQQCPGCIPGIVLGSLKKNEKTSVSSKGMKNSGPNGIEMGNDRIKTGCPHCLKMGNQGTQIPKQNQ